MALFEGSIENGRQAYRVNESLSVFSSTYLSFPTMLPPPTNDIDNMGLFYIQILPVNKESGNKGTKFSGPGNSLI